MTIVPEKQEANGFTLIELLVVIAVIALLLAVILPALNSSKLAAKQVVCASQMRQWALATCAYASENDSTIPPYGNIRDMTKGGNEVNYDNYWYNRLVPYLTKESQGEWGMDYGVRRCPMGKGNWGKKAVWIGVYYGLHSPDKAPFVFLNMWNGSKLTKMCDPVKISTIKATANYLMLLDVQRDRVGDLWQWKWDADSDGDGMNDSNSGGLAGGTTYNGAQPKIHRGGCNVALFDGHVEWIRYQEFWNYADGYPTHQYWYNNNRP
jgi:prepilin-type N-terminal cleavage/methylation domain-containing protein/prepilin-type processing-associated H-X9-DG protein